MYTGNFLHGEPNGKGTIVYTNLVVKNGVFKNGQLEITAQETNIHIDDTTDDIPDGFKAVKTQGDLFLGNI